VKKTLRLAALVLVTTGLVTQVLGAGSGCWEIKSTCPYCKASHPSRRK